MKNFDFEIWATRLIAGVVLVFLIGIPGLIVYKAFFTESGSRWVKSVKSEYTGGLERIAVLYSYDGKVLDTWEGKFDVAPAGNDVCRLFDIDGKRNMVCGGILTFKEK